MVHRLLATMVLVAAFAVVPATQANAVTVPIPADTACRSGVVYLTFDDGPHPEHTKRLLSLLRKHRVRATFYVQGQNAERYPSLIRHMVADGHSVQNHSWNHPKLTSLSTRAVDSQVRRTSNIVTKLTGTRPQFMRPPYGATNGRVRAVIKKYSMRQALWTIDTNDWRGYRARTISANALAHLRKHRSNVILLHDGVRNSARTVDAVPSIIASVRKRGFCTRSMTNPPKPSHIRAAALRVVESVEASRTVKLRVTFDKPSPYAASVRIRSLDGSAHRGVDFLALNTTRTVVKGTRSFDLSVRVYGQREVTGDRSFVLRFDRAKNLTPVITDVRVTIVDSDAWPVAAEPPRPPATTEPPAATPTPPACDSLDSGHVTFTQVPDSTLRCLRDVALRAPTDLRIHGAQAVAVQAQHYFCFRRGGDRMRGPAGR